MVTTSTALRPAFLRGGVAGPALFVFSLAAAVVVFWEGLSSLVDAWSIPEYSHGPIIPLISLFLFLREMREVPPVETRVTDRWPGVLAIMAGLLVGGLGVLSSIHHIVTYGFMIWVAGMVLVCFGFRRGVLFWPAVVHLVFMLPLPQFIYWEVSSYLQFISSELGVAFIAALGIPVYLDGNIIDLGVYKLQVAEACSGLRYLFPMLSFSYVFAILYQGPRWHKIVLLLSAAPITVLMNSFRIGVIGVMVDNFGIEHAEGFLHTFEGWIIFVACVLILFGMATAMQYTTADPKPLSQTLDIEFEGLGTQLARINSVAPSASLAAAFFMTAAVGAGWALAPDKDVQTVTREPFVLFPRDMANWRGTVDSVLNPEIERVLAADDYLGMTFSHPDERSGVNLFMAFYHDQTDGTGIHSPEVCIPAGGWEVSDWRTVQVTTADGVEIEANRALIQKGTQRQLVYFWFDLRGRRIAGDFHAKFANTWDAMNTGRSDGALVRLITPVLPDEQEDAADARLRAFMDDMVPILPRFVPN